MGGQGKRGWLRSVLRVCVKYGELGCDRAVNLHAHDVEVIAKPAFKNEGLALVVHMTVFTEEVNFSTAVRKVGNQEQVAMEV